MRRALAILGGALVATSMSPASAGPEADRGPGPAESAHPAQIIGGRNAAPGKWPDVAAVLYPATTGDTVDCTGTLITPTVVLTAGHCIDPTVPPLPDRVLIGAHTLARSEDGEIIPIARQVPFPDALDSRDVGVLVLAQPSTRPPRPLATGWVSFDVVNGAAVALVGYGAINRESDEFVDELQEASSTITDVDCSRSVGCNEAAQPAGELGAGGMGIDTCRGDSGGPLYLVTSYGAFLAGVTSRSYEDAMFSCSEGGIYARPDKVVDWIEQVAGVRIARGPEPTAPPIEAIRGAGGDTVIAANDPKTDDHRFAVAVPPMYGEARVRGDGTVRVCLDPQVPAGVTSDALTVTVTDADNASRSLPITIQVQITDGAPAPCDFSDFEAAGCCETGGSPGGASILALGALALLRRRRR